MMEVEAKTVVFGGQEYPVRCDMNVLEKLQDVFGTLNNWENGILGIKGFRDSEEIDEETEKPKRVAVMGEISIRAVRVAFVLMVNEAIEIENEDKGTKREKIPTAEFLRCCRDGNGYVKLASDLHDEFLNCFVSKNAEAPQSGEEKTKKKK